MFAFVKHIKVERQPKWCTREREKKKKEEEEGIFR